MNWSPHHNTGKTLEWGKDISEENMNLLKQGEVFTLLDEDGEPYCLILKDSFGTIREKRIEE